MPLNTYQEELQLALSMAAEAGAEILRHFGSAMRFETKADASPVTVADRKAEEIIRDRIARHTPDYGVLGEEFGRRPGSADREWVIDPIDGTKSFIAGVPLFGTLIALLERARPVVGVVALPALGKTLWAARGGGCFLDGRPCRVSSVERIEDALLLDGCITTVERLGFAESWRRLRERARIHRGWGDCYGHFLVATGGADAMFDPVVSIWDVAPLEVILEEAGGRFTSVQGNVSIVEGTGLSTNGRIHEALLRELQA